MRETAPVALDSRPEPFPCSLTADGGGELALQP